MSLIPRSLVDCSDDWSERDKRKKVFFYSSTHNEFFLLFQHEHHASTVPPRTMRPFLLLGLLLLCTAANAMKKTYPTIAKLLKEPVADLGSKDTSKAQAHQVHLGVRHKQQGALTPVKVKLSLIRMLQLRPPSAEIAHSTDVGRCSNDNVDPQFDSTAETQVKDAYKTFKDWAKEKYEVSRRKTGFAIIYPKDEDVFLELKEGHTVAPYGPVQGWKLHYQPPTNPDKMVAALKAVTKVLVSLRKNKELKYFDFKMVLEDDTGDYFWKTATDPPSQIMHKNNNLFGKMVTIYPGAGNDVHAILEALHVGLKEAGITKDVESPLPPTDCRITKLVNGTEEMLPGFSLRYGLFQSFKGEIKACSSSYMWEKNSEGQCKINNKFQACPANKNAEKTNKNTMACKPDTRLEEDNDNAHTTLKNRQAACRPEWVTWAPDGIQYKAPCKGKVAWTL